MKHLLFLCLVVVGGSLASLDDDFEDILATIPFSKIQTIVDDHSAHDPEYKEVVEYLHGKEWNTMVNQVNRETAFKILREHLYQIGLDIQRILNFFKHIFDGFHKHDTLNDVSILMVEDENMRHFLDEIEAVIPKQKILAVVLDKLRNSADFQKFYQQISNEQTHKLVNQTLRLPTFEQLMGKLEHMGVRAKDFVGVLYALLGWEIPDF